VANSGGTDAKEKVTSCQNEGEEKTYLIFIPQSRAEVSACPEATRKKNPTNPLLWGEKGRRLGGGRSWKRLRSSSAEADAV